MDSQDLAEVDVLLLMLVAQVVGHRQQGGDEDAEWVSMAAVEALCQRIGHLGAAAIERGWHQSAATRGLLDVRESPSGSQVRLSPVGRDRLGILLPEPRRTSVRQWLRRAVGRP